VPDGMDSSFESSEPYSARIYGAPAPVAEPSAASGADVKVRARQARVRRRAQFQLCRCSRTPGDATRTNAGEP
jgi:hypothetical protein